MHFLDKRPILLLTAALSCLTFLVAAQQKTGFKVIKSYSIKSGGGWDYITVSAELSRIYVSHGNQVNILDLNGDSIGFIPNTQGVHGIALALPLNKGYVSCGRANEATVFDLKTNAVKGHVACGQNPDAIFYDEYSKKVYAFNGRSKDATVIDPQTDQVVATIPLGAKPETGVSDGRGKIFVNAETTNEVVVIDANTYKVLSRYKINDGDEPSGIDIDRKTNRLFIGCGGNKTMVVMDAANGKNLAKFPIGGCDGLVFDPGLLQAYTSNGEGTITVVRELNANSFVLVENIPTEQSARTIGIDLRSHHLFLPAAKTIPNPAGGRPKIVPGTFHVIEVGKS